MPNGSKKTVNRGRCTLWVFIYDLTYGFPIYISGEFGENRFNIAATIVLLDTKKNWNECYFWVLGQLIFLKYTRASGFHETYGNISSQFSIIR